jgi:hypothetical protein
MMFNGTSKSSRLPENGSTSMFNRSEPMCVICLDLNLRTKENTSAGRAIKMSYFEAVESALIGCRFCSLILQGLKTLGARIKESSCIVTVSAQHGKPFSVFWDDALSGRTSLELFTISGNCPELVDFPRHIYCDHAEYFAECEQMQTRSFRN